MGRFIDPSGCKKCIIEHNHTQRTFDWYNIGTCWNPVFKLLYLWSFWHSNARKLYDQQKGWWFWRCVWWSMTKWRPVHQYTWRAGAHLRLKVFASLEVEILHWSSKIPKNSFQADCADLLRYTARSRAFRSHCKPSERDILREIPTDSNSLQHVYGKLSHSFRKFHRFIVMADFKDDL